MIDARTYICLYVASIYSLIGIKQQVNGNLVNLTVVENAVAKGAVCLDGSPPAYHIDKGFGTGINNWLLYIEGGGWCQNVTTCIDRRDTRSGSSKQMAKQMPFPGILSNQAKFNPDFHNWNRVKVRYCDGSSFTGDVEAVDPANNLHFRGGRVWLAVMEDLLAKGMRTAENVLLSGGSAGGLATIIHCDSFRTLLPMDTKVKCSADAAYFLNAQASVLKDVSGALYMQSYYDNVVTTHASNCHILEGSAKHLPASCTSRMKPSLCFFPQYTVNEIQTPLFILNPAYDSWQVRNILAPREADPHGIWNSCKFDITKCSADQLNILHNYRLELLNVLPGPGNPTRGMFINSCFVHCQAEIQETWLREDSPVLKNISIAKAIGDWYYDRSSFHEIDCPYPCDTSCHNNISILTNQARA